MRRPPLRNRHSRGNGPSTLRAPTDGNGSTDWSRPDERSASADAAEGGWPGGTITHSAPLAEHGARARTLIRHCMTTPSRAIDSLEELRAFVHAELCAKENLLPEQSPLSEIALRRGGQDCGLQFCVHGPRLVRLGAVWVADLNQIYLYDARGERYAKLQLEGRIDLSTLRPQRAAS